MQKLFIGFVLFFLSVQIGFSQDEMALKWADSVYQQMNEDQRIGQLFMIRAHSNKGINHEKQISKYIKEYQVGGLCFFQGTPEKQGRLTNKYQKESKIPLLIATDGEWGLGMRFPKTAFSFPRQLTLGAIKDNTLLYEMGLKVAEHCKRVGIHFNFAPVVDINNNPENPVINNRSFGEDVFNVTSKSNAYMQGMIDGGILACAKHFPGHGDTDVDSHLDLPVIKHDINRLDSVELQPFRYLIKQGISAIMAAHLHIPSIDDRPNRATSVSRSAITDLLRNQLGFDGLVVSDALEMEGVAKHFQPGQLSAETFLAGNDIILLPRDLKLAINGVKTYLKEQKISERQLETSVKRILKAKYLTGLTKTPTTEKPEQIQEDINDEESTVLKYKLIENAITLVRDSNHIIPIHDVVERDFASLVIGSEKKTSFQTRLDSYIECRHFNTSKQITKSKSSLLLSQLKKFDVVFVALNDMSKYASKNHGLTERTIELLNKLNQKTQVIISVFGSPYALKYFNKQKHLIVAYEEEDIYQDLCVQAIFGANPFLGQLPVTASESFPNGHGLQRQSLGRIGYTIPEYCMMNSDSLLKIDTIVEEMLTEEATPGCQIMALRHGKVVFEKSYGHFTYDKKRPVNMDDMYDLASVTKVMASTVALMKLESDGKFNLQKTLSRYLPVLDTSNKADLIIEEVLAHQAGLRAWIPFFKATVSDAIKPQPLPKYYRTVQSDSFNILVAKDLFMRTDYRDTIWQKIYGSGLYEDPQYKYSDLTFYLMEQIINQVSGMSLDQFAEEHFYHPLNLKRTGFKPLEKHSIFDIAPTEEDDYFRIQTVHGHVHDMGAAMLGGVSGHAGLFSNAREIAILTQMIMNGGYYGGRRYLDPKVINDYTTRFFKSTRRGMGFDMKELDPDKNLNMSEKASDSTFGHLGFTGTAVFVDPEYDLIFIMFANRTYPTMHNNKYGKNDYRPKVQSAFYSALKDKNQGS